MPQPLLIDLRLTHVRISAKTEWSFVEFAADGVRGIGEATLPRAPAELDAAFTRAAGALAGGTLADALAFPIRHAPATLADAAIGSAIEQAAQDIAARLRGASCAEALGGRTDARIPTYANINRRTLDRTPAGFHASALLARDAGYSVFKVAPFDDLTPALAGTPEGDALMAAGIARVAAVRDAIGAGRQLFVDCHWRFTPATARNAIAALAAHNVVWFECPIPETVDAIGELKALRTYAHHWHMRLAGLEELTAPDAFAPYLAAGAYDVVMPDVKYAGGIAGLFAVAQLAATHGVACAPHNPSGPVSHIASAAACAASKQFEMLEHQLDESPLFFSLVGGVLPAPQDGRSRMPKGHGFGVTLETSVVPAADVRVVRA
jgi:galactonate dehydratase